MITCFSAAAGLIVGYTGLRTVTVTSGHCAAMGLDPISSRPATIGSFIQSGDIEPPKSRFWSMRVGNGQNQPKDLLHQSPPSSEYPYWQHIV